MNIFEYFKSKKTSQQPIKAIPAEVTPVAKTIPANHISKKKKNTYKIMFNPFTAYEMFALCKNTPLAIIELNGIRQDTQSGWVSAKDFPNPCATDMAAQQELIKKITGEKIATTIIEYLDKSTGKPVIQIYPGMIHIFDEYEQDYESHLNHKSRRDLKYQIALREKLWAEFAKSQNQK